MAKEAQAITWFTVNNTVPLIGSAVMIAASFFALSNKVDLVTQKLDTQIDQQKTIIADGKADNERIDNHEVRITLLEQKKTSMASPTPNRTIANILPRIFTSPAPTMEESAKPAVTVNQTNQQQQPAPTAPAQPPEPKPEPSPEPGPSPVVQIVEQILEPIQDLLK